MNNIKLIEKCLGIKLSWYIKLYVWTMTEIFGVKIIPDFENKSHINY